VTSESFSIRVVGYQLARGPAAGGRAADAQAEYRTRRFKNARTKITSVELLTYEQVNTFARGTSLKSKRSHSR